MKIPKPRYSSVAGLYANRGNPWFTRREAIHDFGRNPDIEDAEYDYDHRYHGTGGSFGKPSIAQPRPEYHDPRPEKRENSFESKKANIILKMRKAVANSSCKTIRVSGGTGLRLIACPYGCGTQFRDSIKISEHLRQFPNKSCLKKDK